MVITPGTFVRWHRKAFKLYWRWKSRGGRPPLPKDIRQLIARMVRENITWGKERVADELSLKLGILVSPRTVGKYWPKQLGGDRRTRQDDVWLPHKLEQQLALVAPRVGIIYGRTELFDAMLGVT